MSTSKKKAKKPAARSVSRSRSSDKSTEGESRGATAVTAGSIGTNGKPRRRLSAAERRDYFNRLSQPRQTAKKFDAQAEKHIDPETGNISWKQMTPEQIAINEKKAIRDKKIEQMWLSGIRPELKDKSKPDFVLYFKPNDETFDRQGTGGSGGSKENNKPNHKADGDAEKPVDEEERKRLEQEWLDGLRPKVDAKGKPLPDWNLDTDVTRPESPPKLFDDDDDY